MKEINLFFTDLDSTVLDENYNFKKSAIDCIRKAFSKNFVIIFTSSKTLAEQRYFAIKLGIPVIYTVENGAAIYLPENVFGNNSHKNGCRKFVLSSVAVSYIQKILFNLERKFPSLKFYGNSTLEEIANYTGLSFELAKLAKKREYTETIFSGFNPLIKKSLLEQGLFPQRGSRFITIGDHTDKGKAAKKLISCLEKEGFSIKRIIGVGDGPNDLSLLKAVNEPYIVGNKIHIRDVPNIRDLGEVKI